jgi:hypothetical protein
MTRARLELLLQKKPWVKPSREPIGFVNPAGKLVGVIRNDPLSTATLLGQRK